MIVRGEITKKKLEKIYATVQKIIKDEDCYYTKEEIEKLKEDKENHFIKGANK